MQQSEDAPLRPHQTEWVLLTSGTTGAPKAVVHTLASLTAWIKPRNNAWPPIVWSTFYDIRRYGGLQIFLRAIIGGKSFVLSDTRESLEQFLARLRARGVTHLTGTPTHWRRVLWNAERSRFPHTISACQAKLPIKRFSTDLRATYPRAKIEHAYATTEAGVGFEVAESARAFPRHFCMSDGTA